MLSPESELKDKKFDLFTFWGSWESGGNNFTIGGEMSEFRIVQEHPEKEFIPFEELYELMQQKKDKIIEDASKLLNPNGGIMIISSRYTFHGAGLTTKQLPWEKRIMLRLGQTFFERGAKEVYFIGISKDSIERQLSNSDFKDVARKLIDDEVLFDLSDHKQVFQDNGILHPGTRIDEPYFTNLPAGEVCVCPNESQDSKTEGEIPVLIDNETMIFIVEHNQIVDVVGEEENSKKMREKFDQEAALRNIAEVAIGVNPKARVTGNVLEDEKAGFHWAYGRSDLFGGKITPASFSSPERVAHIDSVYAKESPIYCSQLEFVFADNSRKIAIQDGNLQID